MTSRGITALLLTVSLLLGLAAGIAQAQHAGPSPEALASPVGSAFTYQGRLMQDGQPVNGACDLRFRLFDAASGGGQVGPTVTKAGTMVTDGLVSVTLDFGADAFQGDARWLEVAVRCPAGSGGYTVLSPRQPITPAPYALFSLAAPWSGITDMPAGFADGVDDDTTYSAGTGLALVGNQFRLQTSYRLPQGCSNGQAPKWNGTAWTCGDFWSLTGNGGTDPATNFLGTTDNKPLELRVNNARALRIEPGTSPNIIGGSSGNSVSSSVRGATIGGGGSGNAPNQVTADYATVAGGYGNIASGGGAAVSGGSLNTASNTNANIGGGAGNTASGIGDTVGGGSQNTASGDYYATVGGGANNTASANWTTIGGGRFNTANTGGATVGGGQSNVASAEWTTVSGGYQNTASGYGAIVGGGSSNTASGQDTTVAGGYDNTASGYYATVAGGQSNQASGDYATVGGGGGNIAGGPSAGVGAGHGNTAGGAFAIVGGGYQNSANGDNATVGGGYKNEAGGAGATVSGGGYDGTNTAGNRALAPASTIGGGLSNVITTTASYASIGGGWRNTVSGSRATIAGGEQNTASGYLATVGGGFNNQVTGDRSVIAGGVNNTASGAWATIPGGSGNMAGGSYSFAAGRRAKANKNGCFVWGDSTNGDVSCTVNNRTIFRSSGGFYIYTNGSLSSGVRVAAGGGSWASLSDRNAKENVKPVDPEAVLEKLAHLPVSTWNYKTQNDSIRHMGPMAQDFYAAFGLGEDDTHIGALDAEGALMAAIQGLYARNQELQAQNRAQARRIAALEAETEALRGQLQDLAARLERLEAQEP